VDRDHSRRQRHRYELTVAIAVGVLLEKILTLYLSYIQKYYDPGQLAHRQSSPLDGKKRGGQRETEGSESNLVTAREVLRHIANQLGPESQEVDRLEVTAASEGLFAVSILRKGESEPEVSFMVVESQSEAAASVPPPPGVPGREGEAE
jgi:hypothetical protein